MSGLGVQGKHALREVLSSEGRCNNFFIGGVVLKLFGLTYVLKFFLHYTIKHTKSQGPGL